MARADRVKADPLGSPRSGLALTRSSTPSGLGGLGGSGGLTPFRQRSQVRAGLAIWFASQIKLTFGRRTRRLHQHSACGGQAREDEATLRCGFFRAMQSIGSSTRIGRG